MKKTIFIGCILIAALSFTSCGDSKNGGNLTIDARVSHGDLVNSQVDEVRAMGAISVPATPPDWWDEWETYYEMQYVEIATAPFKNGGFKITLPKEKIDQRLLEPMDFKGMEDYLSIKLNISNKDVKGTGVYEFVAYKNNSPVGYFECYYWSPDADGYVEYVFVDGNCKISGSYSETEEWGGKTYKYEFTIDLDLKKGWNTVYQYYMKVGNTEVEKITTKKPDFDFTWYYDTGYYYSDSPEKHAKKAQRKALKLFK